VQLTYPGVYVTEIPSSVRPIATVSTSIGAFVDVFPMGPVDTAVQIFGMADFERNFGGLAANSPASYQIAQFFLNGGPSAWVVRIAPGGISATAIVDNTAAAQAFTATARSAGTWANTVRLSVEPVVTSGVISTTTFNLGVARYAGNSVSASERYTGLVTGSFTATVNDSSQLVTLTGGANQPATNGTLGKSFAIAGLMLGGKTLTVNTKTVTLALPAGATDGSLTLANMRGMLETAIRTAGATAALPALAGATVTVIGGALWVRTDPRTPGYNPLDIITIADGTGATALLAKTLGFDGAFANVQEYQLGANFAANTGAQEKNGVAGTDGAAADATALLGDPAAKTGMYALENADLFNILCLPLAVELSAGLSTVLSTATVYCERRRAMFLVDIPVAANTPDLVQKFVDDNASSIKSANAAIYFPRVEVPDPLDNYRLKSIGTSGTVAGIYARTDTDRGVWKAPAGIDAVMRGIANLDYLMSDGENGVLNPHGIDCLRNFPVYGQIVWGARTLLGDDAQASEWKYVPVRRLALMMEESLFRGTKWVVFEPNDEPLWAKIRQNVGAFMTGLFRQGAFQGSTPDKAFFVKCDGETTTANDRNLGVVNIEVGFAPLKPAEFVVLKIQQIPDLT